MKRKRQTGPREKDLPILRFIWWWKIASTGAIAGRFYTEYRWKPFTVHWRLSRLRKEGFLEQVQVSAAMGSVWTLTNQGFKIIESELPALREHGFASEHMAHDLYVQAAHLGEWLPRHSANDVRFFSEQELRRINPDCYPEWVPCSRIHRPDGYWNLPTATGRRVVALEVEINSKSFEQYKSVGNFYNQEKQISAVIWILGEELLSKKIITAAKSGPYPFRDIHHFVNLSDFKKQGWNSAIISGGDSGITMSAFLNKYRSGKPPANFQQNPILGWTQLILDTRIKRFGSQTYFTPNQDVFSQLNPPIDDLSGVNPHCDQKG